MNSFVNRCCQFLGELNLHSLCKLMIAIIGGSVVLVGIAMLVLPGPAILVIPAGLAILATEFLWARRWLKRARALLQKNNKPSPATATPDRAIDKKTISSSVNLRMPRSQQQQTKTQPVERQIRYENKTKPHH